MERIANAAREELTGRLLPFWKALRDEEHGGYYGYMDFDLNLDKNAEKGCILNSRILWFFSETAIILKDDSLIPYAHHTYDFLRKRCLDREFGGVYWSLTCDGKPLDDTKHTYNQAFAIYALSARFYMFALPLLPFASLWLPVLPALFLIYPGINENFQIEDQLRGT